MKSLYTSLLAIICLNVLNGQTPEQEIILETHSVFAPAIKQMDINADGNMEFIYLRSSKIQVCENTGDSAWQKIYIINEFSSDIITDFAFGDVNDDGFDDIIYSPYSGIKKIRVLINPTDNSSNWEEIILTEEARTVIGVFDINTDGWNDIIYEDVTTHINYYKNNSGEFTESVLIYNPTYTLTLFKTADIDLDGDIDIVGHFNSTGTLFFKNQGDGTVNTTIISSDFYEHQLAVDDFDGDGYLDVMIRYSASIKIALFDLLSGEYDTPVGLGSIYANDYDVADYDNDGDADILLTKFTDDFYSNINCLEHLTGTDFAPETLLFDSIMTKNSTMSFFPYNLDDNVVDVFAFINGNTHVFINNDGESLSASPITPDISFLRIDLIRLADLNNDGTEEIIAVNNDATIAWLHYNQLTDTITASRKFGKIEGSPYPKQIETADCNNDGYPEVVVSYQGIADYMQSSYYFMNDTEGNFTPHYIDGVAFAEIFFVDANEDGKMDLIGREIEYPNALKYYANTGDTANLFTFIANLVSGYLYDYNMDDIDNDGDQDFLIVNAFSGYIQSLENINPGAFGPVTNFLDHSCATAYNVYSDDADGDGDLDIYYTCTTDVAYFAENIGGSYVHHNLYLFDNVTGFGPGYNDQFDVNADGFTDLIACTNSTYGTRIKLTTGTPLPDASMLTATLDYAIFSDFDDNGTTDIIGANTYSLYVEYDVIFPTPSISAIFPTADYFVEAGPVDSVLVFATAIPTIAITVNLLPGAMVDAGAGVGVMVPIYFNADSTALDTQVVYLTIPDDLIVEDIFINNLIINSDDPTWGIYEGTFELSTAMLVTDNDLGIFTSINEITTIEGAPAVSYGFHLNMVTAAPVDALTTTTDVVLLGGEDTIAIEAGIASTYTHANSIYTLSDIYPEENTLGYIIMKLISDDPFINEYEDTVIIVHVNDNDIADIFQTSSPTTKFTEGLDSFTTAFRPLTGFYNDITITAIPDMELDLGGGAGVPVTSVFPASDVVPANITRTGFPVEDYTLEGIHYGYINFVVSSDDVFYDDILMNTIQIKIDDNYDLLGIDDDVENGISIYPQSGNGNFTINWPQEADVQQILIVNALGQQVYNEKVNGNLSIAVNLSAPQGLYQVILSGSEYQFVKQYLLTK
jgi:hypothetical protein